MVSGGVTETVTIINNSGKVISTGKHIFGIFERAKTSYQEKKAELKAERAARKAQAESGRAHTYDVPRRAHTFEIRARASDASTNDTASRVSSSSRRSRKSSHTDRSDRTVRPGPRGGTGRSQSYSHAPRVGAAIAEEGGAGGSRSHGAGPLTAENLRALATSGATTRSGNMGARGVGDDDGMEPPPSYEDSVREADRPQFRQPQYQPPTGDKKDGEISQTIPAESEASSAAASSSATATTATATKNPKKKKPRARSSSPTSKDDGSASDDDLAYGYIPPNLAMRTDLDTRPRTLVPIRSNSVPVLASGLPVTADEDSDSQSSSESDSQDDDDDDESEVLTPQESEAKALAERIEDLLDEAQCIHHSATAIITHLQEKPEAAAAVALTLAELSAVVAKMSPAFLGTLKGAAPAVFALLASPHFLVAAGVAVGMTVVMFGGWKIVKKISEIAERNDSRMAVEARQFPHGPGRVLGEVASTTAGSVVGGSSSASAAAALLLPPIPEPVEEPLPGAAVPMEQIEADMQRELGGIERWCRGITDAAAANELEAARIDDELLSPEAREAVLGKATPAPAPRLVRSHTAPVSLVSPDDSISVVSGRSGLSHRSHRSERSTKSWSTWRSASSYTSFGGGDERKSKSRSGKHIKDDESEWWEGSSVGSERSVRTSKTARTDRTSRTAKTSKSHSSSSGRKDKHHHHHHASGRGREKDGGLLHVIEEVRSDDGSEVLEERAVRKDKTRGKDKTKDKDEKKEEKKDKEKAKDKDKKKDGILKSMFKRKVKEEREGQRAVMV